MPAKENENSEISSSAKFSPFIIFSGKRGGSIIGIFIKQGEKKEIKRMHIKDLQIIAVLQSSVVMYFAGVVIMDSLLEIFNVYESQETEVHF